MITFHACCWNWNWICNAGKNEVQLYTFISFILACMRITRLRMREKVLITIYKLNIQLVIRYNYRLNYNFMCIFNDDQLDCRVAIPSYSTGKNQYELPKDKCCLINLWCKSIWALFEKDVHSKSSSMNFIFLEVFDSLQRIKNHWMFAYQKNLRNQTFLCRLSIFRFF